MVNLFTSLAECTYSASKIWKMSHFSIHSRNWTGHVLELEIGFIFSLVQKVFTVALWTAHKMIWHVHVANRQHNVSVGHINTLLRYGLNASTAWWLMWLISVKTHFEGVSVEMMVTLMSFCDTACVKLKFFYNITTGYFWSCPFLRKLHNFDHMS